MTKKKPTPKPAADCPAYYKQALEDPDRERDLGRRLAAIAVHRVAEKITTRRLAEARRWLEFLAANRRAA